ncbi:hypothetical protein SK128_022152 [Halocaridina rubra]|uniref:EGF-like domain-containing protein n=1 Tax=Halocaridina rubra TaxID=373956 RepID=A0AAN8X727_HALRR
MEIFFQISWRRNSYDGGNCNDQIINNGDLIGSGSMRCQSGCSEFVSISMEYRCTDYSSSENWSFGERRINYNFSASDDQIRIGYSSCCWVLPFSSSWNVATSFSLKKRNDTGRINSTPRALTAPVMRLQLGCNHTIAIPVSDPDGDIVRCRWAETRQECDGVCDAFPSAVLNEDSCTITYEAIHGTGLRVAALMIEDFVPESNTSLSSVALQFIIDVFTSTASCSAKPEFISPTFKPGTCIALPPNTEFFTQLIATAGASGVAITEIVTVSPAGFTKSPVTQASNSGVYYVNITWSPKVDQYNQIHSFCFHAVNSVEQSSELSCIQMMVGFSQPTLNESTLAPKNNEMVNPESVMLEMQFTQPVQRPSVDAYLMFVNRETNVILYSVNFLDSSEISFTDSQNIVIQPNFTFPEKTQVYVEMERGIVVGFQGCGPTNEPITDDRFWTFFTKDITPPSLLFMNFPSRTNRNVTFLWTLNEPSYSFCSLDAGELKNCSGGEFNANHLSEGYHSFFILHRDLEDNSANTSHIFYVDVIPPNVTFSSVPENISNANQFAFNFHCDEDDGCSYFCSFQSFPFSDMTFTSCPGAYFMTPLLIDGNQYVFSVYAVDSVNNVGNVSSYMWNVDLTPPNITITNAVIPCISDSTPNSTGFPTVSDNMDAKPTLTYSDYDDSCTIARTWMATDVAGNIAQVQQIITMTFLPHINFLSFISFSCSSDLGIHHVSQETASAPNPCNRPFALSSQDDLQIYPCPGFFNRTWTLNDSCMGDVLTATQIIELYDICSAGACGRNYSQPHGICLQGSCLCNRPWYGDNCDILIYTPQLQQEEPKFLLEGENFNLQTTLIQGTQPITWSFVQAPERSNIDYSTGQLSLNGIRVGNYTITVRAQNQVGYDELSIYVVVSRTYTAKLDSSPFITLHAPQPLELTGIVEYDGLSPISTLLNGYVPVCVDVYNTLTGVLRSVDGYSNHSGYFSLTYYPSINEYGKYEAWARHPSESKKSSQTGWKILGMHFNQRHLLLEGDTVGNFQNLYKNVTILINDGPGDLHSIQAQPLPIQIAAGGIILYITFNGNNNIPSFTKNSTVNVDISLETPGALYSSFPVIIQSIEGTKITLAITIDIKENLPMIKVSPPQINSIIIRGKQKAFNIAITNIGKISGHNLSVILPDMSPFTVLGFGLNNASEHGITLGSNETAFASLLVQIPTETPLGTFSGSIRFQSLETFTNVAYQIKVASDTSMNLTVAVEDEYTYFAEGNPLVSDAMVTLINNQKGIRETISSSETGTATFVNIIEDRYELNVEAPGHNNRRIIVVTSFDNQAITVFLERRAVTVTWSVTPVSIKDTYTITVETDFQVNVPMPVVTVTPYNLNIENFELGLEDLIELNVTNHGLIRAENVQLDMPDNHPFLVFTSLTEIPVHLEARTSIIILVRITRTQETRAVPVAVAVQWIFYIINVLYSYYCGNLVNKETPVVLRKQTYVPIGFGGWPGFGSGFNSHSSTTNDLCDKCVAAAVGCIPTPNFLGASCIALEAGGTALGGSPPSTGQDVLNIGLNIWKYIDCISGSNHWPICIADLLVNCLSNSQRRQKHKRSNRDTAEGFVESLYPLYLSSLYVTEIFGNDKWISLDDKNWISTYLTPIFDDDSDFGQHVSPNEAKVVLNSTYPSNVTREDVQLLINRFNDSLSNWQSGNFDVNKGENLISYTLLQNYWTNITIFNDLAIESGFDSYADAYNFYALEYASVENWEDEAGVCAVIRIRIAQEATLTREGFLAKLEIENKEASSLENIQVIITVRDISTLEESNEKFSFGNPKFTGSFSSLGNGSSLPSETEGIIDWLIVPYREAAPTASKAYDIGGKLFYTVDDENVEIPLLPTVITVQPDPSLKVHYFWEKNAISDDPFTEEVEETVPFSLGVMIKNEGYGTAYEMKITSGQPEIIENEKGLLISYKIIGATLGNESMSPSLIVDFGDLYPSTTKVARWWMTSSFIGEFKNYAASFENINPLGDPKLSLIDELEIHELIWNVRIPGANEDGVLDFLVSDIPDNRAIPDKLYNSADMSFFNVTEGEVIEVIKRQAGFSILLEVSAKANNTGWQFFTYEGPELSELPHGQSISLRRSPQRSGTGELPSENAWISIEVLNRNRKRHLNILDYAAVPNEEVTYLVDTCESCPSASSTAAPTTTVITTTTQPFAEYNFAFNNVCTDW